MSKSSNSKAPPQPPAFLRRVYDSLTLGILADRLVSTHHVRATGQWGSAALVLAAGVQRRLKRPVLVVTAHLDEADDAIDQLAFFRPDAKAVLFPAHEVLPGESNTSEELATQRLNLLADMAQWQDVAAGSARSEVAADVTRAVSDRPAAPAFYVAPIQALMQNTPGRELLTDLVLLLTVGATFDRDRLIGWLAEHGYSRLEAVEDAGDFAVRGEIVDLWAPGSREPVRIGFFGDQIESIHGFDLETLGPTEQVPGIRLVAIGEKATWAADGATHFLSYLPADTIVWLVEPPEMQEQARSYYDRLTDVRGLYSPQNVLKLAQQFAWAEIYQFGGEGQDTVRLPCKSIERFDTRPDDALAELAELATAHEVVVVCESKSECTRLGDLLEVKHPGLTGKIQMPLGSLGMGFQWSETGQDADSGTPEPEHAPDPTPTGAARTLQPGLVLVGHHEIFHRFHQRRPLRGVQGARPIDSFLDLQEGDFVVHIQHGIAKFTAMTTITREGRSAEYLTLKFANDATLHVPVTQIHMVQKYVGGAHGRPPLSVLGGTSWNKQKEKVAAAVEAMASDLLDVQAAREHSPGIAYPSDTVWMKEFENAFPYQPTEDQVRCIGEIKVDMARPRPMDRLLCGDVGYGKTEVAMRGAFKVCEFGKQVAVLAPTTVLAEQHEQTFRRRMAEYPFVVESVSRFKSLGQIRKVLDRTRMGQVDVLIGTHRLLSKDVQFADLGMIIIDEEQRFGVEHKERLKKLRLTVDILTMTATPIPRTLHMSLLGIRDISNLATPPQDRRSVVTEVTPFDKARIKQALDRELARNGQIYFVHNRVWNIHAIAEEVRQLAPDARILVGHGQMPDHELEDVMRKFINHEADILVSTTIIESGLDIQNANTMFIHEAENFGLSDLHQLRGRVGRFKHRAYCYLILSPDKTISGTAAKRLKAMEEYASLGAGFKIALRDLEIRGAGNILGAEQSGHITAVGYELYCQLLEEAVKRVKNQPLEKPKEVNLDIGVSGSLPRTFVSSDRQRMDLYRRLSRCHNQENLNVLLQDITDAFGAPPRAVQTLFNLAELRILAGQWGISSLILHGPDIIFTLDDFSRLGPLMGKGPGSVRVVDAKTVHLRLPKNYLEGDTLVNVLRNMLAPREAAIAAAPAKTA